MRKPLNIVGVLASLLFLACSVNPTPQATAADVRPLAFINVNVITMTRDGVLRNQTVIIEKDRITKIGPANAVRIPRNAEKIDGRGKYLLPGLIDFHVHLRDKSELVGYLAHGVTTIVQLSGPTGNVPDVLALRRSIAAGEVLGPNIYTSGRVLDGNPAIFPRVSTAVSTPEEARRAVADQHKAEVDFIKVYNNLTSDQLRAVVAEAHQRGLAVVGHIPRRDGRAQALQVALGTRQDMIAHSEEFFFTYFYGDTDSLLSRNLPPQPDRSKIPEVVQLLREAGTAVTPNLSFVAMTRKQLDNLEAVLSDPEIRYLHPDVAATWREQNPTRRPDLAHFSLRERSKYSFLKELVPALQAGGVLLLLGTDSSAPGMFPGKSAQLELQELVAAGLTPYEALATGTVNAGKFIQKHVRGAEPFGTVAAGQRADLLLLDANPLDKVEHISTVAGVMVRGRWLSKIELERLRQAAVVR